jgi:hypothetical protein
VDDRGEMLSKQEFRVKHETEVTDLGTPWDDSVLETEWRRGSRTASSKQDDLRV